jgi:hypothetical protein
VARDWWSYGSKTSGKNLVDGVSEGGRGQEIWKELEIISVSRRGLNLALKFFISIYICEPDYNSLGKRHYRCKGIFQDFSSWTESQSIPSNRPSPVGAHVAWMYQFRWRIV